ncbi:unnamed protein product [Oppiella nova]|uniref:Fucolectin tachylectin-4 pentraxin-1 domain-containing protein n=1 Tax=Oppiella nova TaxID=334625 RepID=A0A7R9LN43_9ACAR|nr:unnamed protein product [Oppiella nova]CAG2164676.1 unnamed protein product [Oppiella nova]
MSFLALDVIKKETPFIQKFYTKTLGEIRYDKTKGRLPPKGTILNCIVKCSALHGCHCVRVNVETNECNTFLSTVDDPNSERNQSVLEKYVYFTNNGDREGNGVNLAIGKKVTQSSTYNQFQASKAIDNDSRTESKTSGGKTKRKGTLPWLQIDMKEDHVITGVMLLSSDVDSLHDFEIRVGNRQINKRDKDSHFTDNPVCFGYDGNHFLQKSEPRVVKCEPCPLMGKYVTIQIVNNCTDCVNPGDNFINLAELEIYGYIPK